MNKKEISEIKRTLTKEKNCLERICGCYVDAEKNKVLTFREAFLSLPEDEMFKYFEIFRKNFSGTLEKNMLNLEFPLEQEMPEGTQTMLLALRDSELKDDELLEKFYDQIIASYYHPENYIILLAYGVYDIPMKTSDGFEMDDASDYMYSFVLCSLCPVALSKAGLCYNAETNSIRDSMRSWMLGLPEQGFLFPAFNDRNTDIHSLLYYTKKSEEVSFELVDQVLGCSQPVTAGEQLASFQNIVEETMGEDCDFDIVRNIHENLNELLEEAKDSPDPVELDEGDMKRLLSASGAESEHLERFDEIYEKQLDSRQKMAAKNIAASSKFEVKTPDVTVKVNPQRTDLIETRILDGRPCLVIAVSDGVEVNGIHITSQSIIGKSTGEFYDKRTISEHIGTVSKRSGKE